MLSIGLLTGAILTPFLGFATLLILRLRKARLGLQWLAAFLSIAISWGLLLGLRYFLPVDYPLATWKPEIFFQISPALLADGFSWPVGFALISVGMAVLLTEASAQGGEFLYSWASSIILLGLGLLAIFAGNQLTLLLAWAAIDLVELAIWLSRPTQPTLRERVILAFSSRAFAVMLSLWGLGNPWAYVFSIILRWGVFPFHLPYLETADLRRGLGTIIRLVPPLTTMPFLARLADLAYFSSEGWMALFLSLMAISASVLWINSGDELESRPFWIIGVASFAFSAAQVPRAEAVLAWALVLALCGSFLFLIRGRHRFWQVAIGYQTALLLGLPYTPFWNIARVYRTHWSIAEIFLIFSHLLIVVGYARLFLQKPKVGVEGEPWSKTLYGLALGTLIAASLYIGYSGWEKLLASALSRPYSSTHSWLEFASGVGVGVAGFGFIFLANQKWVPRLRLSSRWEKLFSFEWVFRFIQWGFRQIGYLYYQIEEVLEGRGGILWAIVLLLILARVFLFLVGG
ncbi:MAG: hypothetical protein Kow0088_03710 [Anaerolineales bacterium]